MEAIKVLRQCIASGKALESEKVYDVPDEVSIEDARVLIAIGKAIATKRVEKEKKIIKAEKEKEIIDAKKK